MHMEYGLCWAVTGQGRDEAGLPLLLGIHTPRIAPAPIPTHPPVATWPIHHSPDYNPQHALRAFLRLRRIVHHAALHAGTCSLPAAYQRLPRRNASPSQSAPRWGRKLRGSPCARALPPAASAGQAGRERRSARLGPSAASAGPGRPQVGAEGTGREGKGREGTGRGRRSGAGSRAGPARC